MSTKDSSPTHSSPTARRLSTCEARAGGQRMQADVMQQRKECSQQGCRTREASQPKSDGSEHRNQSAMGRASHFCTWSDASVVGSDASVVGSVVDVTVRCICCRVGCGCNHLLVRCVCCRVGCGCEPTDASDASNQVQKCSQMHLLPGRLWM